MRETATNRPMPARAMLQRDIDRVSGEIDSLEVKLRRARQIPHAGRRLVAERMVLLETRRLRDQLRNLGEMQQVLRRRQA